MPAPWGPLGLRRATALPPFDWAAEPTAYPGPTALLARSITDGIAAEAVAEAVAVIEKARRVADLSPLLFAKPFKSV